MYLFIKLYDKDYLNDDEWLGKYVFALFSVQFFLNTISFQRTKIPLSSLIEESTVDKVRNTMNKL